MIPVESKSFLTLNIGAIHTRAAFFDVIEGTYHFIGMGQALTTATPPARNALIGTQLAIENLQNSIGRQLMAEGTGRLITPAQPDGLGVDYVVTSFSLGQPIRTILVGLLSDVSLQSIEKLAQTSSLQVLDQIYLNDGRREEEQVDAIFNLEPELILIAGGMEGGASQAVDKMIEVVGLGNYLLPPNQRPEIFYAGNSQKAENIQLGLKKISPRITIAPNIRPSLDVEDLAPAQNELSRVVSEIRQKQIPGLKEIATLSGKKLTPSPYASARITAFLASYYGTQGSIFSLEIGASSISMSAAISGEIITNVFSRLGMGEPLPNLLKHCRLSDITRWLALEIAPEVVQDYLHQKSAFPAYIPTSEEELAIEQAAAQQGMFLASKAMFSKLPARLKAKYGSIPDFSYIVAGGAAITGAASPARQLLMLLNSLQPLGLTRLLLDQHNLLAMLGTVAEVNALLTVQALDAGILTHLATVLTPICENEIEEGKSLLFAKIIHEDGKEQSVEVLMGRLYLLRLPPHKKARIQLRPIGHVDVGAGPDHPNVVELTGSTVGFVIDARGRPILPPEEPGSTSDAYKKWLKALGA